MHQSDQSPDPLYYTNTQNTIEHHLNAKGAKGAKGAKEAFVSRANRTLSCVSFSRKLFCGFGV